MYVYQFLVDLRVLLKNKTLRQNVMAMFINPKPKVSVPFFMIHILKTIRLFCNKISTYTDLAEKLNNIHTLFQHDSVSL